MIHTVTLETAKLLKENGFRQDSESFFEVLPNSRSLLINKLKYLSEKINVEVSKEYHTNEYERIYGLETKFFAAPSSDELLEELLDSIKNDGKVYGLRIEKQLVNVYTVWYYREEENNEIGLGEKYYHNESLPDALAKMWIYLKKEGLL